jgi:hypothetical protein
LHHRDHSRISKQDQGEFPVRKELKQTTAVRAGDRVPQSRLQKSFEKRNKHKSIRRDKHEPGSAMRAQTIHGGQVIPQSWG